MTSQKINLIKKALLCSVFVSLTVNANLAFAGDATSAQVAASTASVNANTNTQFLSLTQYMMSNLGIAIGGVPLLNAIEGNTRNLKSQVQEGSQNIVTAIEKKHNLEAAIRKQTVLEDEQIYLNRQRAQAIKQYAPNANDGNVPCQQMTASENVPAAQKIGFNALQGKNAAGVKTAAAGQDIKTELDTARMNNSKPEYRSAVGFISHLEKVRTAYSKKYKNADGTPANMSLEDLTSPKDGEQVKMILDTMFPTPPVTPQVSATDKSPELAGWLIEDADNRMWQQFYIKASLDNASKLMPVAGLRAHILSIAAEWEVENAEQILFTEKENSDNRELTTARYCEILTKTLPKTVGFLEQIEAMDQVEAQRTSLRYQILNDCDTPETTIRKLKENVAEYNSFMSTAPNTAWTRVKQ